MGLASSRALARQLVSHGHIVLNGTKIDVPSAKVKIGDSVSVREGSKGAKVFTMLADKLKDAKVPSWLAMDIATMSAKVTARPTTMDLTVDIQKVLEFYSR